MPVISLSRDDLDAWCRRWLGSDPVEVLFESSHLSSVTGLRLADGRTVVVKARPAADRLRACLLVQQRLRASGFPCPRPLTGLAPIGPQGEGPLVRAQGLVAHAEEFTAGGELLDPAASAGDYAGLLADLIRRATAAGSVGSLDPAPPWTHWNHGYGGAWPPPDDRDDDLNQRPEAYWLDEVAMFVRARLGRMPGWPLILGHGDWEAQNLRWRGRRPWAVHDWDSVIRAPEPVIVGLAAAVWPAGVDGAVAATVEQSEAFVAGYRVAAGRDWTVDETQASWAAGLWVLAFNAKKAALDGNLDLLDRGAARERLTRAGIAI